MATLLLIVIYIAFLGRGMPDSITGVAWSMMSLEFGVPEEYVSFITVTISLSTALVSLICARLISKFGTFRISLFAVLALSATLFGYYVAPSFLTLCLLAVPLGAAAGLVDNALNDYMTTHYSAVHLNVMHGVYGIGAALSPFLFSVALDQDGAWRKGYFLCFFAMLGISAIVLFSAPLWKNKAAKDEAIIERIDYPLTAQLKNVRVLLTLACVFLANAIEALFVAYGGTYLVSAAHTGEVQASKIIMAFCLGMGFGRMISGFLSIKFRCKTMLMVYSVALLLPAVILLFNLPLFMLYVVFCLIGAMSGPVYPLLIYLAPELFGKERSHAVLGTQIAVAYSGFVVSQLLMSFIVSLLSINIFPILCLVFSAMLFVFVFMLRKSADKN